MAATATLLTRDIQGESLSAVTDRLINTASIYEGVVMRRRANSFQVLQNLGTDMNVKIGSTLAFDLAVIRGDLSGQNIYLTEHQNASQVLSIAASDPTNDRIDIVILRIYDDTFDSSGNDFADLEVVTGTPDASPVAPAVPGGSFVLAEVLVQDTVTQIVNGDITDKRVEAPIRGELVKSIYYTSNDTFTKADHPFLHKIRVRCQGAGGAGGGAVATSALEFSLGGGGGGGGYAEKEILGPTLGTTETVTVGVGGTGVSGGVGNTGGDSSLGSHAVGKGGVGGAVSAAFTGPDFIFAAGGLGGDQAGGTGDLKLDGGAGGPGVGDDRFIQAQVGGGGGSAHLGGGGRGTTQGVGLAGGQHGGGGGGSANEASVSARVGGAGASGVIIIDLYA